MGGSLLCSEIKELEEGGLLFTQSGETEESQALQRLWHYN